MNNRMRRDGFWIGVALLVLTSPLAAQTLTAPRLTSCPAYDVIVTTRRPVLSFFNATGGDGARTYNVEIDVKETFDSPNVIAYTAVEECSGFLPMKNPRVTAVRVAVGDTLKDDTRYYWRVCATDSAGNVSPWAVSRFTVDTASDDAFMGLTRAVVKEVTVSSGAGVKNITDYSDEGQVTFWQAVPPGEETKWVMFDMGKPTTVTRAWMLGSFNMNRDKWLKDFRWLASNDGKNWTPVDGAAVTDNDTNRNILDFKPVTGRYFKLEITRWYGYAPQLNCVILYSPGSPPVPDCPDEPYVLCVGNQMNGFTFSPLAAKVRSLGLGLKTLTVPHHEVSLAMVKKLKRPPVAIILSGNNADYNHLPMFEYNGEYELVRECDIPILGICCGHHMTVMAYGYTYVRPMGWTDITSLRPPADRTKIQIVKKIPLFDGMPNPFMAPEVHGCEVAFIPDPYVMTARSGYVQCMMRTDKPLFTEQFHAEIKSSTNQAVPYLQHFLMMAQKRAAMPGKAAKAARTKPVPTGK